MLKIPQKIFQIYHDKKLIPEYVKNNLIDLNKDYEYFFFDFDEGKKTVKKHMDKLLSDKICHNIDNFPRYCHKSDLLRYCLLYIFGGVYLDCDHKCLKPFNEIIDKDVTFISSFSSLCINENGTSKYNQEHYIKKNYESYNFLNNKNFIPNIMSNGFMGSTKNNPILLDLINYMLDDYNSKLFSEKAYESRGLNVIYLNNYFKIKIKKYNLERFEPFKHYNIENNNVYFICSWCKAEEGNHCFINSKGETLATPNDKKYVFKRQSSCRKAEIC